MPAKSKLIKLIHPDPDKAKTLAVEMDITAERFLKHWEVEPPSVRREFGYDSPLWAANKDEYGPIPKKYVKMTYDRYIKEIRKVHKLK